MKRAVLAIGAILAIVGAIVGAIGVVFVVGMRRKSVPVLNAVRKTGRAMKPIVLRSAGTSGSPTSVVRHVGRTSGRAYQTPVGAAPIEGGFVIALPYGPNTDWLKNVLARGRATILFDGGVYDVVEPEVIPIEDANPHFGLRDQRLHRQFKVREALRVRVAER
jgi:deazaflavin-dependent oxidoreductase (nitroreductase family)